jgi:hypothetical protein
MLLSLADCDSFFTLGDDAVRLLGGANVIAGGGGVMVRGRMNPFPESVARTDTRIDPASFDSSLH